MEKFIVVVVGDQDGHQLKELGNIVHRRVCGSHVFCVVESPPECPDVRVGSGASWLSHTSVSAGVFDELDRHRGSTPDRRAGSRCLLDDYPAAWPGQRAQWRPVQIA